MKKLMVAALCAGLAGCATSGGGGNVTPISMADFLAKLSCELYRSREEFGYLKRDDWVVSAAFELKMNYEGGLNPSATFSDTLSTPGESLSFALPFGVSRKGSRTYNQNFVIYLSDKSEKACTIHVPDASPVVGTLGTRELIAENLRAETFVEEMGGAIEVTGIQGAEKAVFSGKTEFAFTARISDAGPTWVLTHFTGPGPLVSASRTNTGTLTMVFTRLPPKPAAPPPEKPQPQFTKLRAAPSAEPPAAVQPDWLRRGIEGFKVLEFNRDLRE